MLCSVRDLVGGTAVFRASVWAMSYVVLGVLNPAMSAIFSISLLALWWHQRRLTYILLFALSYAVRAICFIVVFVALSEQALPLRMVSNALILLTMALLSIGVSQKFEQRPRYIFLSIIVFSTLAGLGFYTLVQDSLVARGAMLGVGLAAICLTILADMPKRPLRTPAEALLFWLVAVTALTFGCRPLFAMPSIVGDDFESAYWLAISISDTLICSTLAVGIFAIIAVDVTEKIRSEAESDPLSGLLNRRGFERRAKAFLLAQPDLDTSVLISTCSSRSTIAAGMQPATGSSKVLRTYSRVDLRKGQYWHDWAVRSSPFCCRLAI